MDFDDFDDNDNDDKNDNDDNDDDDDGSKENRQVRERHSWTWDIKSINWVAAALVKSFHSKFWQLWWEILHQRHSSQQPDEQNQPTNLQLKIALADR